MISRVHARRGAAAMAIALIAGGGYAIVTRDQPRPHAPEAGSAAAVARPAPPEELDGFRTWTPTRQETYLTGIESDPHWPASRRAFLAAALRSRDLTPLARNNLACGLLQQDPAVPGLVDAFLAMIDDPLEDPVWRQYAVQFAALSAGDDPRVQRRLGELLVADGDPRAGTAALQIQRLTARGLAAPAGFDERLAAIAAATAEPDANRVTAIGILAERDGAIAGPVLRTIAQGGASPAVRRAAVAALGRSGDPSDREIIESATRDADPSVADAARATLARGR